MLALDRLKLWLFRYGVDERVPVVLTQRRIFILPTGAGVLFALVLVVMLIGAINYNLSLGHALVFLLAGIGLVTMVHTFRNLLGPQLSPGRAEAVFAGETAYFPLVLDNTLRQPRRALTLSFGAQKSVTIESVTVDIPPGEQVTTTIPCPTRRRGRLTPGRLTLAASYPLGLFRAWSYPHPPQSCLVYPAPLERPLPTPMATAPSAHNSPPGRSGQEDFSGLRERQANESTRHIAWKAVARDNDLRPLLVKQFDGGAAEELWLDWSLTSPHASASDTETRLSILAGWVVTAERLHYRYGLRLPNREIAVGQGAAHRNACLEALALYGD